MNSSHRFGPERATPPPRAFGAFLRHHRILAGLTHEALAERAGLSARAISDLERGLSRTPQAGTLDLLAEALHLEGAERADFEAAARQEKLQEPSNLTLLAPASLEARRDGSPDQPATSDEQEGPARRFDEGELETTHTGQRDGQESGPPQRLLPLPARRPRTSLVLGLLALLVIVAASSGLAYWQKLWPFGKSAVASATPVPGYVYTQPTHRGGTITFSAQGFPDTTNPWFTGYPDGLTGALWGQPFVVSPTATLLPDELTEVPTLANGDISPDGRMITMRLRPDLKWSDGQPLTTDDFAYWLEVLRDPASGASDYFLQKNLASYQVSNAQTLVLRYNKPYAFAPLFLPSAAPRHVWGSIPHKDLASRDDITLYSKVGSGPFKLESDAPGKSLALVPNPYYDSTTLHRSVLDKLIFSTYPDVDALISAFMAGQTDYSQDFDSESGDLSKIASVPDFRVATGLGYQRLNFNLSRPSLQVYEVRKAIEEAIDRCGLIQQVFGQPCANMRSDTNVPPPLPDYDPVIKTYSFNLAAARQDMQIAGWNCPSGGTCTRDGQQFPPLSLATRNDKIARVQETSFIKQSLAELGIPVSVKLYPPDTLFDFYTRGGILATGQYDLAIWGDYYDLDDDGTFSFFDSSQIPSAKLPLGANYGRVNDP